MPASCGPRFKRDVAARLDERSGFAFKVGRIRKRASRDRSRLSSRDLQWSTRVVRPSSTQARPLRPWRLSGASEAGQRQRAMSESSASAALGSSRVVCDSFEWHVCWLG